MAYATFGGGCFWCTEAVFEQLDGVLKVVSGYCGGGTENPTYEQVCEGLTGHAEVVLLEFDPAVISYRRLLEVFFVIHDPTTIDRQGNDIGSQYRSVIFFHSDEQKIEATAFLAELSDRRLWPGNIVTEICSAPIFYPAEAYHQGYFRRNPTQGYCAVVVGPKLTKFRRQFQDRLKLSFR